MSLACTVYYILNDVLRNPGGMHKWVFYLCMPLDVLMIGTYEYVTHVLRQQSNKVSSIKGHSLGAEADANTARVTGHFEINFNTECCDWW